MTTPSLFVDVADALTERLRALNLPGLNAITAEEADSLRSAPAGVTAIVVSGGESVRETRSAAYTAAQTWHVYVMCRSATGRAQLRDGAAVSAVISAVHGYMPAGARGQSLTYQGFTTELGDGSRTYRLQFSLSAMVSLG